MNRVSCGILKGCWWYVLLVYSSSPRDKFGDTEDNFKKVVKLCVCVFYLKIGNKSLHDTSNDNRAGVVNFCDIQYANNQVSMFTY